LILCGDCLELMRDMATDSVDLVFGSPPYEAARTYGIGFNLKGQEWVDWMVERMLEMIRVSRGLVCMVVEGQTRKFRWSATPALLMADLHRLGVHLRKPPIFRRVGIPGSGGPDFLRNDYEFTICCSNGGKLPWSDNVSMGRQPLYSVGGACSNRTADGARINQGVGVRLQDGRYNKRLRASRGAKNGDVQTLAEYAHPVIANPGNVVTCNVGGGKMGSALAHETEAPFPEKLAEFFIRSFCKPSGIVLDPFSGSGTTAAVAIKTGRQYIAIDVRQSQCDLTKRRLAEVQPELIP
jgi:hypothetical protein